MNSRNHLWGRLTAAARAEVEREAVPAPQPAWVTRVAGLGLAEFRHQGTSPGWVSWALPGFGVALLIAAIAVATWGPSFARTGSSDELVALADPFAGGALLP